MLTIGGFLPPDIFDFDTPVDRTYLHTLTQTDEIAEENRELSINYVPSEDLGVGSGGAIDVLRKQAK